MPFQKNDPKTIKAAKLGGTSGKKHFQTTSKEKLRRLSARAGKLSGKSRRKKRDRAAEMRRAERYEEKIMKNYLV